MSFGVDGGLTNEDFDEYCDVVNALLSRDVPSQRAQFHLVRFIYAQDNEESHTGVLTMKNIIQNGGLDDLGDALEPLFGRTLDEKKGLLTNLKEIRDDASITPESDAKDEMNAFIDKVAGRSKEEGDKVRAIDLIKEKVGNFGDDDDDRAAFYAALALVDFVKDDDNDDYGYSIHRETRTLVNEDKIDEAWRILEVLDKIEIDADGRQQTLGHLLDAGDKASADQLAAVRKLLPKVDDVESDDLAHSMAKDAARRKDFAALLIIAKKAVELGKDESDFNDDEFAPWEKDEEFKKAIGREEDASDDSDSDSDSDDGDDEDGDDEDEGDDDDDDDDD